MKSSGSRLEKAVPTVPTLSGRAPLSPDKRGETSTSPPYSTVPTSTPGGGSGKGKVSCGQELTRGESTTTVGGRESYSVSEGESKQEVRERVIRKRGRE